MLLISVICLGTFGAKAQYMKGNSVDNRSNTNGSAYAAVRIFASEQMMLTGIAIALLVGVPISWLWVHGWGFLRMSPWITEHGQEATLLILAIVISMAVFTNGYGKARDFWDEKKWHLAELLSLALFLRGVGVAIMALLLFYDRDAAIKLGAALTATDPAAIGVAVGMTGHPTNTRTLMYLFLYEAESFSNDFISAVAAEKSLGEAWIKIGEMLGATAAVAFMLGLAHEGLSWYVRRAPLTNWESLEQRYPGDLEKQCRRMSLYEHVALFLLLVVVVMPITYFVGASPIGVVVGGLIFSNYVFHARRSDDPRDEVVEAYREDIQEIWNVVGLSIYLTIVIVLMPYQAFIDDPMSIVRGLLLLVAIAVMRAVYELYYLLRSSEARNHPHRWYYFGLSVILGVVLLGVPPSNALGLNHHGEVKAAIDVFAAVFLSWFLVPAGVWFINRMIKKTERMPSASSA